MSAAYVRMGSRATVAEGDDAYPHVVCHPTVDTRVIRCRADAQWILQGLKNHINPADMWAAEKFCRSKEALKRALYEAGVPCPAEVEALPEGTVYPPLKYGRNARLRS